MYVYIYIYLYVCVNIKTCLVVCVKIKTNLVGAARGRGAVLRDVALEAHSCATEARQQRRDHALHLRLQGYLAHKKAPTP